MAKFPEPPSAARLAEVPPEHFVLEAGFLTWRVYYRGGRHPTLWNTFRSHGPTSCRFDHQLPPPRVQDRQIFYAAAEGPTCLVEVFQDTRVIDRSTRDPWLVGFRLASPIVVLDLTGSWPTRAGASMAINTGPRPRAQRWSRAIFDAYPEVQGIRYPSSMYANRAAFALFERASAAIPPRPDFNRPLADPALRLMLGQVARDIGYGLV